MSSSSSSARSSLSSSTLVLGASSGAGNGGRTLRRDRLATRANFQPRFFDDDDPLFLMLSCVMSVAGAAFVSWISVTPRPDDAELVTMDQIEDLLDFKIPAPRPSAPPVAVLPPVAAVQPLSLPPRPVAPALPEAPAARPGFPDAGSDPGGDSATREVLEDSMLIRALTTDGQGSDSSSGILGDGLALDSALQTVNAEHRADGGELGPRQGGRHEFVARVDIGQVQVHETSQSPDVAVHVRRLVPVPAEVSVEGADPRGIKRVMSAREGTFVACDEAALKLDPSLQGRLSLGWTITGGRVSDVRVLENSTHNQELGNCFALVVRGLRFDSGLTADVGSYTWAVSGN